MHHYDGYRHGRETVLRELHSSFRIRENGFKGILGDLRIAEELLKSSSGDAQFKAGIQSVVRECQTALRSYGRV